MEVAAAVTVAVVVDKAPCRAAPVLPPKKGHPSVSVYLVPAKANCPPAVVVRPSCEQERFLVRRRRRERNRERIESDFGSVREKFRRMIQLACCSSTIADFFGAARKDPALISEPVNCLKQTKGEN